MIRDTFYRENENVSFEDVPIGCWGGNMGLRKGTRRCLFIWYSIPFPSFGSWTSTWESLRLLDHACSILGKRFALVWILLGDFTRSSVAESVPTAHLDWVSDNITMITDGLLFFWRNFYNSETSFWPFYIPFAFWTTSYVYSQTKGFPYNRWYSLHNIHNGGAILMAGICLSVQDDSIFNERIAILWSLSYFVVDAVDCAFRKDGQYLLHACLCFGLGLGNYTSPICRQVHSNSKAAMCELSNPLMHLAKKTRNPAHLVLFALVFTAVRIFWLPYFMRQLYAQGMEYTDPRSIAVAVFYGLNCFWYVKILRILFSGLFGKANNRDQTRRGLHDEQDEGKKYD